MFARIIRTFFLLLLAIPCLSQTSVLASGEWYKLGVPQSGIYKIDRSFLQSLGINPATLDPQTLRVFGNGGAMLPQANDAPRPMDLLETPIWGVGTDDGVLSEGDYFLFYGEGTRRHLWDGSQWQHETNLYTDTAYYFLTVGTAVGMRIADKPVHTGIYPTVDRFLSVQTEEKEEVNIIGQGGGSGRHWFSQPLTPGTGLSRTVTFATPDALDSMFLRVKLVGRSFVPSSFSVFYDGKLLATLPFARVNDSPYAVRGREVSQFVGFLAKPASTSFNIQLENPGSTGLLYGYLDQVTLSYVRRLRHDGGILFFNNLLAANAPATFHIEAPVGDWQLWDITHPQHPLRQPYEQANGTLAFSDTSRQLKQYALFLPGVHPYPVAKGRVENQDLKSLQPRDGLIITAGLFLPEANRLADFHRLQDGLDIEVVTVQQVFNEFSSGQQDITALRDAIRYYWKKSSSFRYVTLMGDASYDYKNRISINTNFVPVYESRNSLDPVNSYSSEDYYGFMEDTEGTWQENNFGDHTLEIGIGRLPVSTLQEAHDLVNKIIRYSTSERMQGDWKNKVVYVADDGDNGLHMKDAEQFASILNQQAPQAFISKLYIDNDQKVIDGSAQLAPITQGKLKEALESGAFMVNYVGHGNERVLAREYVVDFPFIDGLKNRYKLPVMVTATCEFGRYDEPMLANGVSGGERLLLNPEGGAIALLTTTRPVYAFSNFYVNSAFHEHLFDKEGTDYVRLGDIVRLTKNNSLSGVNNRNFALLGDPMLRLAYPRQHVQITEINQRPFVESVGDTLGALEYVQLKGSVVTQAGQPLSGFEGSVFMEVYDRETDRYTLGQENNPFAYKVRENRLFRGEASVVNGNFQFEFILPKNISYLYEPGKITFYAQANNFRDDATGAYTSVRIGGSSPTAQAENQPPKIEMYINDPTFKDGSTVGSSGLLIARVTDESGINISGLGISQDIVLQLNEQTHVLNNYYTAARDTYKEGFIVFPFNGLEPGRYNARLKVWDIHNNLSESEVGFIVSDQPKIRLYNVMCYPNPVQDKVFFRFEHDRIGEALLVNVEFYDLSGKLIQRSSFEFDDSSRLVETPVIETLPGRMQNGIYLFRLKVVSSTHPAMGEEAGKIIIMN